MLFAVFMLLLEAFTVAFIIGLVLALYIAGNEELPSSANGVSVSFGALILISLGCVLFCMCAKSNFLVMGLAEAILEVALSIFLFSAGFVPFYIFLSAILFNVLSLGIDFYTAKYDSETRD